MLVWQPIDRNRIPRIGDVLLHHLSPLRPVTLGDGTDLRVEVDIACPLESPSLLVRITEVSWLARLSGEKRSSYPKRVLG